jgi:hypothetical protein
VEEHARANPVPTFLREMNAEQLGVCAATSVRRLSSLSTRGLPTSQRSGPGFEDFLMRHVDTSAG